MSLLIGDPPSYGMRQWGALETLRPVQAHLEHSVELQILRW